MSKVVSDIQSQPEYIQALEFARRYNPRAEIKYEWVVIHAVEEYKRFEDIGNRLDEKADSLVRYLGIIVSAISLALTFGITAKDGNGMFQVVPSLGLMVVAIVCATRARAPNVLPLPLATQKALQYADAFPEGSVAEASCAAMTHAASVGLRLANERKGSLIRWAFRLFLASVVWLAIAAVITAVWH